MSLEIIKQPRGIAATGNPMLYACAVMPYGEAEKQKNIRIVADVLLAKGDAAYEKIYQQDLLPDNYGRVLLDVSTIVHAHLHYYFPSLKQAGTVHCADQYGRVKVSFVIYVNGIAESNTDSLTCSVYKTAGPVDAPPVLLTKLRRRFFKNNDVHYLYWMLPESARADRIALKATARILGADNSISTVVSTISQPTIPQAGSIYCTSLQAAYLNFTLPAGGQLIEYTVQLIKTDGSGVGEIIRVEVDNMPRYKKPLIYYQNKLGGIETILLRGVADTSAETDRSTIFLNGHAKSLKNIVRSTEKSRKVNTGILRHFSDEDIQEMTESEHAGELAGSIYTPVVFAGKTLKYAGSEDKIRDMDVEYMYAGGSINISANAACPIAESLRIKQLKSNLLQLAYALPYPYDRAEAEIIIQTAAGSVNTRKILGGNFGVVHLSMPAPANGSQIKAQLTIICNEMPRLAGSAVTAETTAFAHIPPVANTLNLSGYFFQKDAGGNPYAIKITNTAQLAYSPEGLEVEILPVAAGTRTQGNKGVYEITAAEVRYLQDENINGSDYIDFVAKNKNSEETATGRINLQLNVDGGTTNPPGEEPVETGVFVYMSVSNTYSQYSDPYPDPYDGRMVQDYGEYGDIWLSFFSDSAGSRRLSVTNLQVNVQCITDNNGLKNTVTDVYICNGSEQLIIPRATLYQMNGDTRQPFTTEYKVADGVGYGIIYTIKPPSPPVIS